MDPGEIPLHFDIRAVNEVADRIKRPGPYIAMAGVLMMIGFSIIFVIGDMARIIDRSISFGQLAAALAIWTVSGVIVWVGVPAALMDRKGATHVSLTSQSIELTYAEGRKVSWGWSDPKLSFDLREWGNRPEKSIVARGTESALTPEAYSAILVLVERKGLVASTDWGYWTIPSSIRPFVRHIRSSRHAAVGHID